MRRLAACCSAWIVRLRRRQRPQWIGVDQLDDKRIYRIYRELELNLRIKPKKRLVRETPQPLRVPKAINEVW